MFDLPPRHRQRLATNTTLLLAVLVALALLGGFLTWSVHATSDAGTETEVVASWSTASELHHEATVQGSAGAFEAGERLQNRPLYFTEPTPELDGRYVLTHQGTDGEPATVAVELDLVLRSVEEIDGREVVHWEERRELTAEETVIEDGAEHEVPFAVNVTAQENRLDRIETEHGATPGTTEIVVVASATLEGSLGGDPVTDARQERLEIEPQGGSYRVETSLAGQRAQERTEPVEGDPERSVLSSVGPIVLVAASLGGIGWLYRARRAGRLELSPNERERLAYERDRRDLEEWISVGSLPADSRDIVEVESLVDLVDIAIDADRRVIEAPDRSRYVVIVDDVRYTFEPDAGAGEESE